MRTLTALLTLILIASISLPATADNRHGNRHHGRNDDRRENRRDDHRDGINDRHDYWVQYCNDLDYEIISSGYDGISSDWSIDLYLDPGTYYVYADGGSRISDLDMYVYGARGRELCSHNTGGINPYVTFTIDESGDVQIYFSVYSFQSGCYDGDFAYVIARDPGYRGHNGRDDFGHGRGLGRGHHDDDRDRYDSDDWWDFVYWDSDGDRNSGQDLLDELRESAYDSGLNIVGEKVDSINGSRWYEFDLPRGRYIVMAKGDRNIDDLDVRVYNSWGDLIAEDSRADGDPSVWFDLYQWETIEIEVEAWGDGDWYRENEFALIVAKE